MELSRKIPREHKGFRRFTADGGAAPAGQVLNALARAWMRPVAQFFSIGVKGGELLLQRGADVNEPVGREDGAAAGWLPFGAGRHLEA